MRTIHLVSVNDGTTLESLAEQAGQGGWGGVGWRGWGGVGQQGGQRSGIRDRETAPRPLVPLGLKAASEVV